MATLRRSEHNRMNEIAAEERRRFFQNAADSLGKPERSRWGASDTFAEAFKGAQVLSSKEKTSLVGDSYPIPGWNLRGPGEFLGGIRPELLPFQVEFIGYPALALLRQNIIIQNIVVTYAEEVTKKWVKPVAQDDDVDDEIIKGIERLGKEKKAEDFFRKCFEEMGFNGGCLAFIDVGDQDLQTPLSLTPESITPGSLKGFKIIEAFNTFCPTYNSSHPLDENYFVPEIWNVYGTEVHASRFLYFAQTTLPMLLKPAYNFFGIPLPQMILDYLYNFQRSRDASAMAIRNHSLLGLKTDMQGVLQSGFCPGDPSSIINRIRMMQGTRDQNGIALVDREEEFFNITTPLSGLMELNSQQMELLALVTRLPVTKLFGTPPRGFNATGDSEKEDFGNVIMGLQKRILQENVEKYYAILQLNAWGKYYPNVDYIWNDPREMTEKDKAEIQNTLAQRDAALVGANIIDATEARESLAAREGSGYENIAVGVVDYDPEKLDQEQEFGMVQEESSSEEEPFGGAAGGSQPGSADNLRGTHRRARWPNAG